MCVAYIHTYVVYVCLCICISPYMCVCVVCTYVYTCVHTWYMYIGSKHIHTLCPCPFCHGDYMHVYVHLCVYKSVVSRVRCQFWILAFLGPTGWLWTSYQTSWSLASFMWKIRLIIELLSLWQLWGFKYVNASDAVRIVAGLAKFVIIIVIIITIVAV